jgi:hypothetical protein
MANKYMTMQQIGEQIYKPNNWDGENAHKELDALRLKEEWQATRKLYTPVYLGVAGISAYNVMRMGALSGSGRIAALAGLAWGSLAAADVLMN